MKIEPGRGVSSSAQARKTGSAAAPGFAPAMDAPQKAAAVAPAGAAAALDAILALQVEDAGGRRARQARRGGRALDTLEELERGLLLGWAPARLRAELDQLQRGAELTGDARLDAVLREIDIRLAVEAAKLDRQLGRG
jgi:hypothetical protein